AVPGEQKSPAPRVVSLGRQDLSPALRDIPAVLPSQAAVPREVPRRPLRHAAKAQAGFIDPVAQTSPSLSNVPSTSTNFEGVGNVDAVLPPDTNGDVGPNHYVQWVNLSFAIYSKSGALLYGPAAGNTIWSGFGGPCEATNDGDPIVLYDELADRWVFSQLSCPNNFFGLLLSPFYHSFA